MKLNLAVHLPLNLNSASLGLGPENMMESKVGVLSGGHRHAMALLMTLMTPFDFLILDEHTVALDQKQ